MSSLRPICFYSRDLRSAQWKGTNSNIIINQDLPAIEIGQDTDLLLSAVHSGEFLEMHFFWIFGIGATTRTWQEIQCVMYAGFSIPEPYLQRILGSSVCRPLRGRTDLMTQMTLNT